MGQAKGRKPAIRRLSTAQRRKFFEAFAATNRVSEACRVSGMARGTVYKLKLHDPEFAAAWEQVEEELTESLEVEAIRRARDGHERGVWHNGELVGNEQQFSDGLLIFMLKSRRPEVYRENARIELTGAGGGPIEVAVPQDELERSRRAAALLAGMAQPAGLIEGGAVDITNEVSAEGPNGNGVSSNGGDPATGDD